MLVKVKSEGEADIGYGSHMARSMAIGLLFMSGGRCSLSNSNAAIALLLISCYPRWPIDSNDNRHHLQPFRHLVALAAERRCLQTRHTHSDALWYYRPPPPSPLSKPVLQYGACRGLYERDRPQRGDCRQGHDAFPPTTFASVN